MKAYRGRSTVPLIHNWLTSSPGGISSWKEFQYPLNRKLCEPQTDLEVLKKRQSLLLLLEFDPRIGQPSSSEVLINFWTSFFITVVAFNGIYVYVKDKLN